VHRLTPKVRKSVARCATLRTFGVSAAVPLMTRGTRALLRSPPLRSPPLRSPPLRSPILPSPPLSSLSSLSPLPSSLLPYAPRLRILRTSNDGCAQNRPDVNPSWLAQRAPRVTRCASRLGLCHGRFRAFSAHPFDRCAQTGWELIRAGTTTDLLCVVV
jgi:hypothetical protein